MTQQMATVLQSNNLYSIASQLNFRIKYARWAVLAMASALLLTLVAYLPAQAADVARTVTNGNLHLKPGEVVKEDVFVMSGNVVLAEESRIEGDLSVMSGNIDVAKDAVIKGDVTSFSGDIKVLGEIRGDVVALSGNIDLLDGSSVRGDATVVSGNLNRDSNAEVRGDTIKGGGLGKMFSWNEGDFEVDVNVEAGDATSNGEGRSSRGRGFGGFIAGIFGALFKTIILAAVAAGAAFIRPSFIESVQRRMKDELALCFATGLALNLGLFFLSIVAAITVIGLIVAIPILIMLPFLNLIGAVIAAAALGDRLIDRFKINVTPSSSYPLRVAVGTAMIIGPLALLWAMGGCFSFIAFLGSAALSTIGTGAIVLPWARKFFGNDFMQRNQTGAPSNTSSAASSTTDAADSEPFTEEQKPSATADVSDDSDSESAVETEIPIVKVVKRKPKADADDFTKIRGVGAVFASRLQDAGVNSYAQLAAMSAEEIGEIFGWPADRVERDDIIGQAKELAGE